MFQAELARLPRASTLILTLGFGLLRWNCAWWSQLEHIYDLMMPGNPWIYLEAVELTFKDTHLHRPLWRSLEERDPATCSQGHIFVKFAKVGYYFVLPLDGDPQTMCCSGPTNLDPPCTEAPPNPVQSESLAMWPGHLHPLKLPEWYNIGLELKALYIFRTGRDLRILGKIPLL